MRDFTLLVMLWVTSRCFCAANVACNFGLDVDFYDDGTCCNRTEPGPSRCVPGVGGAGGGGGVASSEN